MALGLPSVDDDYEGSFAGGLHYRAAVFSFTPAVEYSDAEHHYKLSIPLKIRISEWRQMVQQYRPKTTHRLI
ncbi:MAG: hypothetical protein U1F42_02795 [Candidatus Competibacteraceae bacterium]